MLTFVRHCAPLSRYQFRNVTQVDRDYRDNLFEPALSGRYVQGSD